MSLNRTFAESNFQVAAKLTGKVVEIDAAGNLVTDVSVENLSGAPHDASLRIVVDEHETFGLFPLEHRQPALTLVAIADKIGPVRVILVDDNASAMLGIRVGAPVEVHW
jgi:S-adenosylmethionine hydrolase